MFPFQPPIGLLFLPTGRNVLPQVVLQILSAARKCVAPITTVQESVIRSTDILIPPVAFGLYLSSARVNQAWNLHQSLQLIVKDLVSWLTGELLFTI